MKYHVVSESTIKALKAEVNSRLVMGWKLQGGVSTVQGKEEHGRTSWGAYSATGAGTVYVNYIQAMTFKD